MSKAFVAGVLGGLVMALALTVVRWLGFMELNLSMILGTMFGLEPSTIAWLLGFGIHLLISGLIALLYGLAFEKITHRATWGIGAAFSIVHLVIGGLAMPLVPAIHWLIPEMIAAPGAFMSGNGAIGIVAFAALHLVYGAIVGGIYTARHEAHVERGVPVY